MKLLRVVLALAAGLMMAGAAWAGTIDFVNPGAGLTGANTHGPNVRLDVGAGPGVKVTKNGVGVSFAGTSCPAGSYLTGFDAAGVPVCTSLPSIQPPLANQRCLEGFYLEGFDGVGDIICKVLPGYFDLAAGLVAYYPFSGNANDAIGSLHGTVSGALLTEDRHHNADGAYWFDGVDDQIVVGTTTFTVPATVSCWFQSLAINDVLDSLVNWTNVVTGEGFSMAAQGDGRIRGRMGLSTNDLFSTSYPDGDGGWHLATMTRSEDTFSLYIDGEFQATLPSADPVGTDHVFYIGRSIPTANIYPWSGKIDEVRIYNRALPPPEVLALFQTTY